MGLETIIRLYAASLPITCCKPAAKAHKVLPLPAFPIKETIGILGSKSKSKAKFCSLFLGPIPQPSSSFRSGIFLKEIKGSINLVIAVFFSLDEETSITN